MSGRLNDLMLIVAPPCDYAWPLYHAPLQESVAGDGLEGDAGIWWLIMFLSDIDELFREL